MAKELHKPRDDKKGDGSDEAILSLGERSSSGQRE